MNMDYEPSIPQRKPWACKTDDEGEVDGVFAFDGVLWVVGTDLRNRPRTFDQVPCHRCSADDLFFQLRELSNVFK